MVKIYESAFSYDYSFPAVTLAYFLRYPNPYSTHVLSTDVISRDIDSQGRLHTVRIHRKRTRLPSTVLKFLPHSVMASLSNNNNQNNKGGGKGHSSESYILERSTIDIKEGWMRTESRNLDWTGVLSVVERQEYQRQIPPNEKNKEDVSVATGITGVVTTVIFRSRLGNRLRAKTVRATGETTTSSGVEVEEEQPKKSLLASWSTSGIQKSIEAIASHRTENHLHKSKDGMVVVLERMRSGGLMAVLEGMRKDKEVAAAPFT
ncbi:Protein UPS1, mitochondrial [Erysiphe neolycopersici]|uniref:Protein UPS1, mitochondrial n=1 Tax=Erysiphe neolycopersici TaxID=212602 RepID=A0A420HX85_9PEZI|nr:Protein UPS1, mitochondrial [Erysiphe neolycopersici]